MLRTAAAVGAAAASATGRRLRASHALGIALALVASSLVLHSQWQLSAAHKELQELRAQLGGSGRHAAAGSWRPARRRGGSGGGDGSGAPAGNAAAGASGLVTPQTPFWRAEQERQQRRRSGAAPNGSSSSCSAIPGTLCLDMTELLGLSQFMNGITWEPKSCFAGLSKVFPHNATALVALKQRVLQDLTAAVAAARGVEAAAVNASAPWWGGLKGVPPTPPRSILSDAGFLRWQVAVVRVLARYMVRADNMHLAVPCPGAPWSDVPLTPDDLPVPACANLSDVALIERVGRHGQPQEPLDTIASVAINHGMCTVPARDGFASYGDFLMARVMTSAWRTFDTRSLEEDAVVFLWDVLYQTQSVFLRQRWLGVAAMQSPFDFLAIGDIVHEVAPDVVLETGTANGGSALMWASLLELNGLTNSSVITVDLSQPGGADAFGADSAAPAQVVTATGQVVALPKRRAQTNPTQHELWRKYVTFVQGSSVEAGTVARIRALLHARQHQLQYGSGQQQQQQQTQAAGEAAGDAAAGSRVPSRVLSSMSASSGPAGDAAAARASAGGGRALRVLVVLDSHHTAAHVLAEMEAYCGLVSAGSFCIVQDTKLSRWTNADPGPLAAVRAFVGQHPEFRVQRDRELLFTHHPYGYLQRLY